MGLSFRFLRPLDDDRPQTLTFASPASR